MTACSTFSSARNVRSTVVPARTLRSFVRTNAPPLPGLTCWNSTTWNSPSGRSRLMPFLRSLVEIVIWRIRSRVRSCEKWILGRVGQATVAGGSDHECVLDAHTAVFREVDPGPDGHHVPGFGGSRGRR